MIDYDREIVTGPSLWDFLESVLFVIYWTGELEYCYYSNVAPVWVEFISGWIGAIIILLGLCFKSVAWGVACQDIWWEVSLEPPFKI